MTLNSFGSLEGGFTTYIFGQAGGPSSREYQSLLIQEALGLEIGWGFTIVCCMQWLKSDFFSFNLKLLEIKKDFRILPIYVNSKGTMIS